MKSKSKRYNTENEYNSSATGLDKANILVMGGSDTEQLGARQGDDLQTIK